MKQGYLSEYFIDIACKRLSAVEILQHRSNQHEFNATKGLKEMLGASRVTFKATFIYLNDIDSESLRADGYLTWYDARENHLTRSEYRLYFPSTSVSRAATEGDLLLLGRRPDNTILVIIAKASSTIENQILWLFGINGLTTFGFSIKNEHESDQIKLAFTSRYILEQLGVEIEEKNENYLEQMLALFNGVFPTTKIFSDFSRSTLQEVTQYDNPDEIIMSWIEREEILFRTLERHMIKDRLRQGFEDDPDSFISYSLSVQNRRKSRAGSSLENHIEHLFCLKKIKYSRATLTEGRSKPDFIFPGKEEYLDPSYPASSLYMLGVKSTCKDRWRQILTEADRIEKKHLFTLEPSISDNQTDQMQMKNVQLILPQRIHESYTNSQQLWLMNLNDFILMLQQ